MTISTNLSRYTVLVTVYFQRKNARTAFVWTKRTRADPWTVSHTFRYFMRVVAFPNSRVMPIHILTWMKRRFNTADAFGCKTFLIFKPWKDVTAKYIAKFYVLDSYMTWVVSFTPLPPYPRGKNPRYPLDRRLGGPQNRSGRRGEEKILDSNGTRTPTPRSSSP
jgi:hypothetical protein